MDDNTLTPYEFAMAEINLALSRLARASTADEANTAEAQHSKARLAYRRLVELHPRLRLEETQREALLEKLAMLRARLEECEGGP